MIFNPEVGTLGYSICSLFKREKQGQFKDVFVNISPPQYPDQNEMEPDARFYVHIQATAGYTFKYVRRAYSVYSYEVHLYREIRTYHYLSLFSDWKFWMAEGQRVYNGRSVAPIFPASLK